MASRFSIPSIYIRTSSRTPAPGPRPQMTVKQSGGRAARVNDQAPPPTPLLPRPLSGPAQPGAINRRPNFAPAQTESAAAGEKNLCMRLKGKLVLFPSHPSRECENLLPGRMVYFR